ncbi:MAG: MMPL family transporter [Chloroflexi bacterium]|nr:MMPL family transporter [Chloroflexota bacterium]
MNNMLAGFSWLVTVRPWLTLLALVLVTFVLGFGTSLRAPPQETAEALPKGSSITKALTAIEESFGDSEVRVVTLLFRGDALTPDGLSQMSALLGQIASDRQVSGLLSPVDPIFGPSMLVQAMLQVPNFDSVSQAQIDGVLGAPQISALLDATTGVDEDGTKVAIASVQLQNTGDDAVKDIERRINDLAIASEGPLAVSSMSFAVIEDEYIEGTETGVAPLIGLALLLIALLILLFMRTISDLVLTLVGLFVSIIWITGAEGWLGPNGLGIVAAPNPLSSMVPIIIIGLTVDYAIQAVSHYREQRLAGEPVEVAVRVGLRNVTLPLVLAAVTTIVSLLAGLFSPIDMVGDFGVVGGFGVGLALIVMLTLLPAGRTILDRRREARGKLKPPRPIATALPGVERLAAWLGRSLTRRPAPYIIVVVAVTVGLGYAATGLDSEYSIRDLLPRGGTVLTDLNTLDTAVGGSTEMASVIVQAEATQTRTLLNVREFEEAFDNPSRRPSAAAGPVLASYELLIRDWTTDSGEPGDKYDAEIASRFQEASAGIEIDPVEMQAILDAIEAQDPALSRVLVNNPNGIDAILLQFPAYTGNPAATKLLQDDIEARWFGEDDTITVTSEAVISFAVTDAIRDTQTESIGATVAVALGVLGIFFWVTVRQPALALIAVGPTVLVMISVLGTMALLGIPYTLVTSIITALSIGIGVDYTIHVIHRYREEYAHVRDPQTAAVRTLATTGSALLGSALTTALGIGVLIASPMLAMQQFGITAAITIAYSLIVSILVVPPAMTVWGAYQNMRLRSMVRLWEEELDLEIEAVYRRHEED